MSLLKKYLSVLPLIKYSTMRKVYSIALSLFSAALSLNAQNISVNTTGAANSSSSMFEVLQPSGTSGTSGLFVRHSGSPATAYGLWVEMTGAPTNKYAIIVPSGSGRVGLGTSAPLTQLTVAGDGAGQANIGGGFCGGNYTGISLNGLVGGCGTYNILSSTTDQNFYLNRPTGYGMYFRENNGDQMYIAPTTGYVGIGTTLPNRKLEIYSGNGDAITFGQQADNTQTIQTYIDGQWANRATYAGGCCNYLLLQPDVGVVGIGTTSPVSRLNVVGKTTLARDGTAECCGNDATLAIAENSAASGLKSSISFHNGGQDEGTIQLTGGAVPTAVAGNQRRFKMFDNQGINMGLEITGKLFFGNSGTRTETLHDAGANGGTGGAQSGFFETWTPQSYPADWPVGASSWWHLIQARHSNNGNNYAMQIAGGFWGTDLYYRMTADNAAAPWYKLLNSSNTWGSNIQSAKITTDQEITMSTSGTSTGFSDVPGLSVTITPIHSTVYVFFSMGHVVDMTVSPHGQYYSQFRILSNGATVAATTSQESNYTGSGTVTGANTVVSGIPISVTPGNPTTIKVQWDFGNLWKNAGTARMRCFVSSLPDYCHGHITIVD